ncbi:MAG: hypothetical protein SGARI_001447, partial [Bacillariaceae sp.]
MKIVSHLLLTVLVVVWALPTTEGFFRDWLVNTFAGCSGSDDPIVGTDAKMDGAAELPPSGIQSIQHVGAALMENDEPVQGMETAHAHHVRRKEKEETALSINKKEPRSLGIYEHEKKECEEESHGYSRTADRLTENNNDDRRRMTSFGDIADSFTTEDQDGLLGMSKSDTTTATTPATSTETPPENSSSTASSKVASSNTDLGHRGGTHHYDDDKPESMHKADKGKKGSGDDDDDDGANRGKKGDPCRGKGGKGTGKGVTGKGKNIVSSSSSSSDDYDKGKKGFSDEEECDDGKGKKGGGDDD